MKKLGIRNLTLIIKAVKDSGWVMEDAIAHIEESLYIDEAMMIIKFLKWLQDKPILRADEESLEKAFADFKKLAPQKTRKKGRPIIAGSKRQARLAGYEEKRKKGIEVKPGRPTKAISENKK